MSVCYINFNNSLQGNISDKIDSLSNLQNLGLGENMISGVIPRESGNLTRLQALILGSNSLDGCGNLAGEVPQDAIFELGRQQFKGY
ncbi:conserved hypothetical protein [Ricinus communis]|uniref:Serine-threonine protein kinase, plant-type n=1 Tax=Ricinus communis TaxID=3988 RepID=B9STS1_RICCO|nr:conserved hypothetical protein [Ricinus communis]